MKCTRHIVIKTSNNGTFEVGDHIAFNEDGSISCREAGGWIDQIDAKEASAGMDYVPDKDWVRKRKEALLKELASLAS